MKKLLVVCVFGVFAISGVKSELAAQDHIIDRSHETIDCRFQGSTCTPLPPVIVDA